MGYLGGTQLIKFRSISMKSRQVFVLLNGILFVHCVAVPTIRDVSSFTFCFGRGLEPNGFSYTSSTFKEGSQKFKYLIVTET